MVNFFAAQDEGSVGWKSGAWESPRPFEIPEASSSRPGDDHSSRNPGSKAEIAHTLQKPHVVRHHRYRAHAGLVPYLAHRGRPGLTFRKSANCPEDGLLVLRESLLHDRATRNAVSVVAMCASACSRTCSTMANRPLKRWALRRPVPFHRLFTRSADQRLR